MRKSVAKKKVVARMFTIVSKLEQVESFAHEHGVETPHGVQNMIQEWYEWVSQQKSN